MKFDKVTAEHIRTYRNDILKNSSASTFDRKIFSLKKFFEWAVKEGYIEENPVETFLKEEADAVETKVAKIEKQKRVYTPSYGSFQSRIVAKLAGKPKLQKAVYAVFYTRPKWYQTYHSLPIASYFNYAILVILMSALGFGIYSQFFKTTSNPLAYPSSLTRAGRYLSFQGRLTNILGNPINSATNVDFKLYNASSSGTLLWDSGVCSITPDTDGIFSTLLGNSCGTEIASSVFSENSAVWLGVTVGSDTEATPRVQIATVAYALNSETLQGYPASAAATANTVPVINNSGQLVLAVNSPKIQSTSGNFAVEGQAITLNTPSGSNGSINIAPDGTGSANFTFSGATPGNGKGMLYITDANLNSKALIYGSVTNDSTGYNLLELASGTTPRTKFAVDSAGNATLSGTINGLAISGGTITSGTWNGSLIGTQYGGTGANNSAAAQYSIPYYSGTGVLGGILAPSTAGYVLSTNSTGGAPSWISASGIGTNYWQLANHVLAPSNALDNDLAIGGNSTASAKLLINAATGNLITAGTASVSGNLTLGNGSAIQSAYGPLTLNYKSGANTWAAGLTVDDISGNVGIGTTAPTAFLNVVGPNAVVGAATPVLNILGGTGLTSGVNGTAGSAISLTTGNGGSGTVGGSAAGSLSLIGGVGGTGSGGGAGAGGSIVISGGNGGSGSNGNGGSVTINPGANGGSGGTNGNIILANLQGNVGIGTASPAQKLDVNGNLNLTGYATMSGSLALGNTTAIAGPGNLRMSGDATISGVLTLGQAFKPGNDAGISGYVLTSSGGGVNTWTNPATLGTNYWQLANHVLAPSNALDYDLAVGGNSTASAKLQVLASNGNLISQGNASISGSLTFRSGAGSISTTTMSDLTIGGSTTGNVIINSRGSNALTANGANLTTGGNLSIAGYATASGSLALGNTTAAAGPGHLNMSGNLTVGGTTTLGGLTYTWPGSRTNGFLTDNGSGTLSWTTSLPSGTTIGFDKITGATNTSAAMVVGTGASLNYTGTGTINATTLLNSTWAAPGAIGTTTPAAGNFTTIGATSQGTGAFTTMAFTYATASGSLAVGNVSAVGGPGNISASGTIAGKIITQNGNTVCDTSGNCPTGTNYWKLGAGTVSPFSDTLDVLFGNSATASAKFAFTGVNSGTPTASISGTTANVATYLNGNGNLSTTNMAGLTIGSSTTGNIVLNSRGSNALTANGANLTVGGILYLANGTTYYIDASGNVVANAGTFAGNVAANGGNLTTTSTGTAAVFNTNATTLNIGGAAGTLAIGAASSTTTFGSTTLTLGGNSTLNGGTSSGGTMQINSSSNATKGNLSFNGTTTYVDGSGNLKVGGYATASASLALGNTTAAAGPGHLNMSGNLTVGGTTTLNSRTYTWPSSETSGGFLVTNGSGSLSWSTSLPSSTTIAFNNISSGTNTTAAMLVGAGASLNYTSTGTINASSLLGNTWAAPGAIGTTTPNTGAFTTLNFTYATASASLALGNTTAAAGPGNLNMTGVLTVGGTINGLNISSGTITNATWNGNLVTSQYGGTGANNSSAAQYAIPYYSATGVLGGAVAPSTSGYVLSTNSTGSAPTWIPMTATGTNYWKLGAGTVSPFSDSLDVLFGNSATTSAKFAFKNVLTGTPTASISGSTANVAMFIDGNGNISTTNRADLAIGNSTTYNTSGNTLINPNGTGYVGIGKANPSRTLDITGNTLVNFTKTDTSGHAFSFNYGQSVAAPSGTIYGVQSQSDYTATSGTLYETGAGKFDSFNSNAGTVSRMFTVDAGIHNSSTGTVSLAYGIHSRVFQQTAGGTITNAHNFYSENASVNAGTLSNLSGFTIDNMTTGSNNTNLLIGTGSIPSGNYSIYNSSAYNNYIAGNLGIGVVSPSQKLDVSGNFKLSGYATMSASLAVGNVNAVAGPGNISASGTIAGTVLTQNGNTVCDITGNCTAATDIWSIGNGALYPKNSSADLLIGASATSSAKFAFKNVLSGTPTASISGSTTNVAMYMDGNGNISTTNRANLVLGNSGTYNTTGNILLNPNGLGLVGIGTTTPQATLHVAGNYGGNAAFIVNQTLGGDILTASASGATKMTLANDGTLKLYNSSSTISNSAGDITIDAASNFISLAGDKLGNLSALDVAGNASMSGSLFFRGSTSSINMLNGYDLTFKTSPGGDAGLATAMTILNSGNIGIGTTNPSTKLHVASTGATSIRVDSGTTATNTAFELAQAGNYRWGIVVPGSTTDLRFYNGSSDVMTILNSGNVGIGTVSPAQALDVNGYIRGQRFVDTSSASYYIDPAAATVSAFLAGNIVNSGAFSITTNGSNGSITLDAGSGHVIIGDGSTSKLDAGTIDPPYTINGSKYATYVSSMTGVKEETTGIATTSEFIPGTGYRTSLDFANAADGSDLWVFSNVTKLSQNSDKMVVLLSPAANTKAWYSMDSSGKLYIYTSQPTTVSYRLTAPRFDADNWANTRDNGVAGFTIDNTNQWSALSDTQNLNEITFNDYVLVATSEGIQKYNVLNSVTGQIVQDVAQISQVIIGNIKAGAITTKDIASETFNSFQGTVDNMLVKSGLVAGRIQTKLISPLADATDITVQIGSEATPSGKFAVENSNGDTVASIDNVGNATFSGTLFADKINSKSLDDIQNMLAQVKTDQDLLAAASNWSINSTNSANLDQIATADLYVTNQAAINSLSVTNSLTLGTDMVFASTINSSDNSVINSLDTLTSPLKIQSLAMAPVEIMAGLIKIDTNGNVQISGNLAVAGNIDSAGLTLKDNPNIATPSANLLTLQNSNGSTVSTVDASGSATFNNIMTQGLTIAGATDNATASSVINGTITSNATAGSAIIPAGTSEITIKNNNVTDYTLVYVTPTSSTNNYVLYVKSKGQGQFVVGFTNPIDTDVNFNWWVVQIKN